MLKEADALVVVWGVVLVALPFLGLFTFALTLRLPRVDWIFAVAVLGSAGLNTAAHLASTRALKLSDASLVTPLLVFSPMFTMLISAFFLGEIPSARGLLGMTLILIGAYWLNRDDGADWLAPFRVPVRKPGVRLVLLAGLLWAVTPLFEKTAILHTVPESPRVAAFAVSSTLAFLLTPIVLLRGKPWLVQLSLRRRELILAGMISGIAPVLGYTALSLGLVGYVTTLFRFSVLLTMIWSFLLLKEPGLKRRLPSSLVMIIGAILITA